jgi:hypothetical protein
LDRYWPGGEERRQACGCPTARRELVENEIYEHAIRLFAERGFAGTSLQDIADALGITRPALYLRGVAAGRDTPPEGDMAYLLTEWALCERHQCHGPSFCLTTYPAAVRSVTMP